MSNFPTTLDDDTTLPPINDNITELGGELLNALREAVFNIESNIGLTAAGSGDSLSERLGISILPDGSIKPSAIASMGLVTLPIYNSHIAATAEIDESKLNLDHSTQDLYNYTRELAGNSSSSSGWISATGVKVSPHISGSLYRHNLDHITVGSSEQYLTNKFAVLRDNSDSYELINDINDELLHHQLADGTSYAPTANVTTHGGSIYSSDYAHTASGVFIDSSNFISISSQINDLQLLADFIDSSSVFLYGSRIQNFYANAISRKSRSSSLNADGYGQNIIPATPVTTFLRSNGLSSTTVDDIDEGDDIVEFFPESGVVDHTFDAKFSKIKAGDIIKINYGSIETSFIVKEKKYIQNGVNKKYVIRIAGKNLLYTESGVARIDRSLSNTSKFGNLAVSTANNIFAEKPSLIVGSPRGASVLGIGFNAELFGPNHYLLYLVIYPSGSPEDGYTILPSVDVTGNRGRTPGSYSLESIVQSTNDQFRKAGYNYRFNAFTYGGEFGIMLSDSYNNCSFSILNVVVANDGTIDELATAATFTKNVVGVFTSGDQVYAPDPLGFGTRAANIASPAYRASYGSAEASQYPTKIFSPLKRNNFYVNGIEKEKLTTEAFQILDGYGDGYWAAEIVDKTIFPGPSPSGRVKMTYRVEEDLSTVDIQTGKTIVVQPRTDGTLIDCGRFIIESVTFGSGYTDITVYDAVHGAAISPSDVIGSGSEVALYFSSDSVSFNTESATDFTQQSGFKIYSEVYIDENGKTFTHQRARVNISDFNMFMNEGVTLYTNAGLVDINIVEVSPKLKGYQEGSLNKITFHATSLITLASNTYTGYLCYYDGADTSRRGPLVTGKVGVVSRFYDETNIDYIDIIFNLNNPASGTDVNIDIQLFPTLGLDEDIMLLASCQLDESSNTISNLRDRRQFGNISEKELSTSALNFISASDRLLRGNGVVRGFDLSYLSSGDNPIENHIYLNGGVALVNGKLIYVNNQTLAIPTVKELRTSLYNINWAVCINDKNEYKPIALLDYDVLFGTPSVVDRVMNVLNPATGLTYNIEADTFSSIVNNRKDLAILYIVKSTVNHLISPAGIVLEVSDARRYVNDSDTNLQLKLTSDTAQGNFRNVDSILNWVVFNNSFNGVACVRGATEDTGIVTTEFTLDFDNLVTIDGENNAILTINTPIILGSNITFKNLTIIFNAGVVLTSDITNLVFDNCTITYLENEAFDAPIDNIIFNMDNSDNVTFKDCSINVTYVRETNGGAIFKLNESSKFSFINNDVTVDYNYIADSVVPGNVFEFVSSDNLSITKSIFTGNFHKLLNLNSSNSIHLDDVSVTSTYNPNISSPGDYGYDTSDLVNSGSGFIYSNIDNTVNNIYINNVTFNYFPVVASGDRFSFINFELSTINAMLTNLNITNCKFNHLNTSLTVEDIRPAISIVNTSEFSLIVTSKQPILSNVLISHNYCNRNQSIIVTSNINSNLAYYPGLSAQGVTVANNICGMIGYWVSSGSKASSITPNFNSLSDKDSSLLITGNTCHYIASVDHTGIYWDPFQSDTIKSKYPSGNVTVSNNRLSWIHTGVSHEENSSLQIKNNSMSGYDVEFLTSYNAGNTQKGYSIYVASNPVSIPNAELPGEGNDTNCIISGNTTTTGYYLSSINILVPYTYERGYIWTLTSSIIVDNTLRGIAENVNTGKCILLAGLHNIVSRNKIYRKSNNIICYINVDKSSHVGWGGVGSTGIISHNFFDSPYADDDLNEEVVLFNNAEAKAGWTVEKNINQTVTLSLPLTNSQLIMNTLGAGKGGYISLATNAYYVTTATTSGDGYGYKSPVLRIRDSDTATARTLGWQENLDKHMPIGTRVISVAMNVRGFTSSFDAAQTNLTIFLNKYDEADEHLDLSQFSSATDTDAKIINDVTEVQFDTVTGVELNGSTSSLPLLIDTTTGGTAGADISDDFISGKGYGFSVSVDFRFKRNGIMDVLLSPVVVKYRW